MQFSQPVQKFSKKGPKLFALSATKNLKAISCEKTKSNYSSDHVEGISENFFKKFLPIATKNFPKKSEETKRKLFS